MKKFIIQKSSEFRGSLFFVCAIFLLVACGPNTTEDEADYKNEIEAAENQIDPPPGEKLVEEGEDTVGVYEREEAMGTPTDTNYTEQEVITPPEE